MKVRRPAFDFAKSLPLWMKDREFCHILNASSVVIMQLEPYLNKVMLRARTMLPSDDPLQPDLKTFVQQETAHCRLHARYNRALYEAGYDRLKSFEAAIGADYERYLDTKSMKFNLGYCQGFECLGPLYAELIFEGLDDLYEGGDEQVIHLWKWHLAEEYEHRMVAHDAYYRLGGNWLHRLYSTYTTLRHLKKYSGIIAAHMLKVDRASMSPDEVRQSRRAAKRARRRLAWFLLPRFLPLLSPFYTPARHRPPNGLNRYLGEALPI